MTSLVSVTLEVSDPAAAERFYTAAFGLGPQVRLRACDAPTTGFRGFSVSVIVSRPADVDGFIGSALTAGATPLRPAARSLWGYGGILQAPDGTIWQVTTSSKKDTGPATGKIDDLVLLLGAEDVKASRQFYTGQGLSVTKSFGGKYTEFAADRPGSVKLALYKRRGLAKTLGVSEEGGGSHRIVLGGTTGAFTDPDGFVWEPAPATPTPA
ncbi:glyoxalase [Streptomyces sp. TRM 70361]|uniref:glyoxalase n=1 Tax=Streptomyces sp. TRM 70361 TaxID=3116553 RepID=UPI002E7BBBE4|nr:glyoxalase [Streptomyces sp. TRM 70361]MEE1943003.1 glyoxalase [Streptomyces sp. TRM 70361]